MNGNFLIPANSKRSQLIFGIFNVFDLILFLIGLTISVVLLMVLPIDEFEMSLIAITPGCIIALLVFPVPNHHNVLTAIITVFKFFTRRRMYIWKGWCVRDEYK